MDSEESPDIKSGGSSFLKSFAIYFTIFIFGFVAASFGGGVKDSIKGTANLAVNTAKETFAVPGVGEGEFVPLKSSANKNIAKKTPVVNKPKPSLPVVVLEEKSVGAQNLVSATNTVQNSQITESSTTSVSTSSSSAQAVQPISDPPNPPEVSLGNSESVNSIKFSPLIYEIRITGGTGKSKEDYIKIFNPNPKTVDLSGWKLRKRTQSGDKSSSIRVFPDGTSVEAGKVLTWANSDYASVIGAELSSTITLADNNSVGLLNKDGVLIDAVGWGESSGEFVEGSAYSVNPEAGQVLLRKQSGGLLVDTQNNSADFEIY